MNSTDELLEMVHAAEDAGLEVYVWWFNDEVIERVEVEGVEFVNECLDDELDDWRIDAERFWRE